MAFFVVCASPLVKVFLPEWHETLLDNPGLIFDEKTDFGFSIAHGVGAFRVEYNKPMAVVATRLQKDDDLESKYNWLIGEATGSAAETDIYGLVPFEANIDLVQRSDEIAQLSMRALDASADPKAAAAAQKEIKKIQDDTSKALAQVREQARARSAFRVKRAMKTVHNNLVKQWQRNEEMKLGKFPPSMTELFGAHVLDAEIRAAADKGSKIKQRMNELMTNTATV